MEAKDAVNRKSMPGVGRPAAGASNATGTGASRRSDIDPEHLAALNAGTEQARTLTEALAINHVALLAHVLPEAPASFVTAVGEAQPLGILKRMTAVGTALHEYLAPSARILDPLRADHSRYVQDSVANWINDAAKTRPEWAQELCARWIAENPAPETRRIAGRALRSLSSK